MSKTMKCVVRTPQMAMLRRRLMGVEGPRDAAQPTSHGLEDAVWLRGCAVGVERKTQSAGEGSLRDLLRDVLALAGVGVDHDTHGATCEAETA